MLTENDKDDVYEDFSRGLSLYDVDYESDHGTGSDAGDGKEVKEVRIQA